MSKKELAYGFVCLCLFLLFRNEGLAVPVPKPPTGAVILKNIESSVLSDLRDSAKDEGLFFLSECYDSAIEYTEDFDDELLDWSTSSVSVADFISDLSYIANELNEDFTSYSAEIEDDLVEIASDAKPYVTIPINQLQNMTVGKYTREVKSDNGETCMAELQNLMNSIQLAKSALGTLSPSVTAELDMSLQVVQEKLDELA